MASVDQTSKESLDHLKNICQGQRLGGRGRACHESAVYVKAKKVAIRPIRTPMLTVDDVAPLGLPQVDIADRQAKGAETDEK